MLLLGIDVGSTNSKAGLFDEQGKEIAIAQRPTITHQNEQGQYYYDPEEMWATICSAIREAVKAANGAAIGCVGITSMAESGLLVHRTTGVPQSPFMPWFDTCTTAQAERIAGESDLLEGFRRSGLHLSYKLGLAKLLWIQEHQPEAFRDAVWLSAAGYIAYRLTGQAGIDPTLAARTYAFRLQDKTWDAHWLANFGISPDALPPVLPSGSIVGHVSESLAGLGLPKGTPVAISGHDHVCSALAVGAIHPGRVYDSMGTAETMVGTLDERELGEREYASGLSFGCHIAKDRYFWMGGNSASGGSVEWLRTLLDDEALSYEEIKRFLDELGPEPTSILYYPYLTGSGAPQPDPSARAAFIGLTKKHGKGDMIKAVLEGTSYQLQSIRRSAEEISGREIDKLIVVGGGTRNAHWMQIKSDVLSCPLDISSISEATLLGAAIAAGIGAGVYASAEEAAQAVVSSVARSVQPDAARHGKYRSLYESGYLPLQEPLRQFYSLL